MATLARVAHDAGVIGSVQSVNAILMDRIFESPHAGAQLTEEISRSRLERFTDKVIGKGPIPLARTVRDTLRLLPQHDRQAIESTVRERYPASGSLEK
jgi:hypothetical protein